MKVILREESKPCEICVSGQKHTEPLNSPCGGEGRFYLVNASEKPLQNGMYAKLKSGNHLWYWDAETLEEFDMFYSVVGYRLDGTAVKMLREAGYEVEIETIEERKAKNELAEKAKKDAEQAEKEAEKREKKEWQDIRANMIPANFVSSGYIGHVLTAEYVKVGEVIRPNWKVTYYNHEAIAQGDFEGQKVVVEWFGNASIVWGEEATILKLLRKEIEDCSTTKAEAQTWLEKYRERAGTEYMQLIAGEIPTLQKFKRYDE